MYGLHLMDSHKWSRIWCFRIAASYDTEEAYKSPLLQTCFFFTFSIMLKSLSNILFWSKRDVSFQKSLSMSITSARRLSELIERTLEIIGTHPVCNTAYRPLHLASPQAPPSRKIRSSRPLSWTYNEEEMLAMIPPPPSLCRLLRSFVNDTALPPSWHSRGNQLHLASGCCCRDEEGERGVVMLQIWICSCGY